MYNTADVRKDQKSYPETIHYYNETEGGVNVMDQQILTYVYVIASVKQGVGR